MNRLLFILILQWIPFHLQSQHIQKTGNTQTLEIANWNLEWYGKTTKGYGPDDDAFQQTAIKNILDSTEIDLWALCEISDSNLLRNQIKSIGRYQAFFSPYEPEQKTAFLVDTSLYKVSHFELLGKNQKDSFSTLRFPFHIALTPRSSYGPDTLHLIVLHLKANTGNETEKMQAYNSRSRSAEWLKMYLGSRMAGKFCVVLGDWNDDIDESVYNGLPTPFNPLKKQNFPFQFISAALSNAGISSTVSFKDFIDHQLVSSAMIKYWVQDSVKIIRADQWFKNYGTKVSDHYPVISRFNFRINSLNTPSKAEPLILYPIPARDRICWKNVPENAEISIFGCDSRVLATYDGISNSMDISALKPGLYFISFKTEKETKTYPIVIE